MFKKVFHNLVYLFVTAFLFSPNLGLTQNLMQGSAKNLQINSNFQAILDSVRIEQLYLTEKHLTGEEPFWLDGKIDSLKTRFSYSTEIFKAQDYIRSRLESFGYAVELHPFSFGTFYDIKFSENQANYGWLATEGRIFATTDSGQTWNTQYQIAQGNTIWSLFPLNNQLVFAVGSGGLIVNTINGDNWQVQTSPVNEFLFGVYFLDENLGWICGDNGVILKTINGGLTWLQQNNSETAKLYDICFVNENSGWAVGRNGTILHSINSGSSWVKQNSVTNHRLYGVHFLDENKGFAVGENGTVLVTINAGTVWNQVSIPGYNDFYDIDFLDQTTGMIVSQDGVSMRTTNGGESWDIIGNIDNKFIYGLDIINSETVWVCGLSVVAKSDNFGSSWQIQSNTIALTDLNNVIATINGLTYPDQYYILGAHYDATSQVPGVKAPGADDNGSGTAAVIEAARVLKDYSFDYSIKFMLFAGEEQGLFGSRAYANEARNRDDQIMGVINLDMIAYDGNSDRVIEIHSGTMSSSQLLGNFVFSNITDWGLFLSPEFKDTQSSTASDHSSFWSVDYPAIMIIEDFEDFTPFYHTTDDMWSTLDPQFYLESTILAVGSIASLAEVILSTVTDPDLIPDNFILYNPYPNPFNPRIYIDYYLPVSEKVELAVFDMLGKRVKLLINAFKKRGQYHLSWDGRTGFGSDAPSGVYFIRLQAQNHTSVKKIILLR